MSLHHVVQLRTFQQDFYLLWEDGDGQPDRYVTTPPLKRFLVAKNRGGIARLAEGKSLALSDEPPHTIDIPKMRRVLDMLRPGKPVSQKSAETLLDSWNALEDMCRSIGVALPAVDVKKAEADRVYEKLFYGNNLPSVTPPGRKYQPVLTGRELAVLRSVLRGAWAEISRLSEQFQ